MSLFGGILAGAMIGGGNAWQVQARDEEHNKARMALEAAREKAAMDRAVTLEGMRATSNEKAAEQQHGYRREELGISHTQGLERLTAQDALLAGRAAEERGWRSEEAATQRAFVAGESAADRANRLAATSISANREREPRLIPQGDGTFIQLSSDGSTKLLEHNGQPIKGPKDMDQRTLKLIDSMQSNRDLLIRNDPMGTNAPEVQRINKEIQTLIRGGTGEAAQVTPSANAVTNLGKFKDDPGAILAFDRQYGTGAAAKALGDSLKAGEKVDLTKPPTGLLEGAGRVVGETVEGAKKAIGGVLGNDANRPGWKEPVLNERDVAAQREMDTLRERQARDAARVTEMRDLIQPDRIRNMSPEEARAVLETYDTRLPGKAKAMLRDRLR